MSSKLFKTLNIDYEENLKIVNVDVDVSLNQITIYFIFSKLIEYNYYNYLKLKFNELFSIYKAEVFLKFSVDNIKLLDQNNLTIIEHYKHFINSNLNLKNVFNNVNINIEDESINFICNNKFKLEKVNNNLHYVLSFFYDLGLANFKYNCYIDEVKRDDEIVKRINEKKEKIVELSKRSSATKSSNYPLFGEINTKSIQTIKDVLNPDLMLRNCTIEAEIYFIEVRQTKKSHLLIMNVVDKTGTINVKAFCGFNNRPPTANDFNKLSVGMYIKIYGRKEYDKYANDETIMAEAIFVLDESNEITNRIDNSEQKRIELHLHSKMSKNNGISSMKEYIDLAKHFNHSAIAITDHGVCQGFVDMEKEIKGSGLKAIYGIECGVVNEPTLCFNANDDLLSEQTYCIFDLETTGLSANFNKIIEIGAVKLINGEVVESFQRFIKIDEDVSEFITSLTGITNVELDSGDTLNKALKDFYEWSKNCVLVAHNAIFDLQFLARNYENNLNLKLTQPVIDTLELSRFINVDNTFHSLKILAKKYKVQLDSKSHHRADYDAQKLTEIFVQMLEQLNEKGLTSLNCLNKMNNINKTRAKHNLLYVVNQKGLPDLYKLVSDANTKYYQMEPRIYKPDLEENRKNLLYVASGCSKSEMIDSYLNHSSDDFEKCVSQFDYVEVQCPSQYQELINNDSFKNVEQIHQMINHIIEVSSKFGIKVIASGNVHYALPDDYIYKEILYSKDLKADKVKKDENGNEVLVDKIKMKKWISDNSLKNQNQYLKTTEEMLQSFYFLDEKIAKEIVIKNTNIIFDQLDDLVIVPDNLATPEIEGVDVKLKNMVYEKAHSIYGSNLPDIINKRLDKELKSIIGYGFSVIYYISHKLVKYSLDNGYLVGSRGSVGSSLVATFMDITEINPLPPHYVCPQCCESKFITDSSVASGYDLPQILCEKCNCEYIRDGQDIPFETFLGFEGDKVPDIDLNFSGEFQSRAHDYVRASEEFNDDELFDFDHAFRAGTIGTIAEKTAYGLVKGYFDLIDKNARRTDISYQLKKLVGIKRTTGQHPGGIIVVPKHMQIYDFTPIQFPADDTSQTWRTTHFDFHSIHDNLLKLDILGHDDPTMLKRLFDSTGVDPKFVNITDPKVMMLFSSTESLNVTNEEILTELGTMGVPEFGTSFVMEMLKDTKPTTFGELVQISGLSHGTDVWLKNAKDLIDSKVCKLKDVIGCRDDIMVYLMYKGLEPLSAFKIMENVRKGKGLTESEIQIMKNNDVADWYIQSCQKIKYMFPKAHAAAYVLMALRIAYFKVYYPLDYYASYFSSRVDDFDTHAMIRGKDALLNRIKMISEFDSEMSDVKKKSVMNSLKMCLEMCSRGYKFLGFSLEKSESFEFIKDIENNGLIMPFSVIEGLGEKEAINIVEQREICEFKTKQEFKKRTKVKNKTFEQLEYFEVFNDLVDNNQTTLF